MIRGKTITAANQPAAVQRKPALKKLLSRHVALPAEHGAWVFLFSPLAVGLSLGGVRPESAALVTALLAAFLIRQPLTIAVKTFSGRRPRSELAPAAFWLSVYGLLGLVSTLLLLVSGFGYTLWLALPALPVLAWHLWLVSRRAERRQIALEITASGVLALAAPAAYWVGTGSTDATGWLLGGLCWLQSAGSILYAFLRLEQRVLKALPAPPERLRMALPALVTNLVIFQAVVALAAAQIIPPLLPLAFLVQPLEVVWGGLLRPAVGVKPVKIGMRQLAVSTLFTLLFIFLWR